MNEGFFNTASAALCLLIYFVAPFVFIVFSYISYEKIQNPENQSFFKSFGCLYEEFKNNKGFFSTQYYFIFFLRRVAYILSQIYLNNLLILQNSLNLFFSLVQTFYLIYYKPFKEKHILLSNYIGEICVLIVFSDGYMFLLDLDSSFISIAEKIFIFSVLFGMALQFLIALYCLYLAIKELILKCRKKKLSHTINESKTEMVGKK